MTEATAKHYDTITSPVITEKATLGAEHNQYVFKVPLSATKPEIAEAVEALFDVEVKAVNTLITKGKSKRFRGRPYTRSDVKKAVVTLKDGFNIDMTTGL